jgi:putative phosphoribosyl transferase
MDAGMKLADVLMEYKVRDPIVLAIPRGGVEIGYHVARSLDARFSMAVSRKMPFPENPEAGFGAIAEDGSMYLIPRVKGSIPETTIREIAREQKDEIKRRIAVLRGGKPLPSFSGETVIIVDDGIAMGSTMRATVAMCRNKKAEEIIVGAPVTSSRVKVDMERIADHVVILETPSNFFAVAQDYLNWYDVSDREVLSVLENGGYDLSSMRFREGKPVMSG